MDLENFLSAYIECALWSTTDNSTDAGGDPLDKNYDASDLADETLVKMRVDCERFLRENEADLANVDYAAQWSDTEMAGHDFWLTRNGHGAGFWDRDLPEELAARLTDASKRFGEVNLYVGDDGKIYG